MKVVGKSGTASIVEFERDGLVRRCLLPKTIIREHGNRIPPQVVEMGMEIGVEVEEAFDEIEMPTREEVLNYLRKKGIWTSYDILANTSRFRFALIELMGSRIQAILQEIG